MDRHFDTRRIFKIVEPGPEAEPIKPTDDKVAEIK